MLKVAIIGCGKIADSHASQISRVAKCEIVAVCDREPLMASQLSQRFPVKNCFTDLGEMLHKCRPDVVHITTPPESHFDVATRCLDEGCHVYVEKPFALSGHQTESLLRLATQKGLKITAGHDDQFSHAARRMRTLIGSGFLGDGPVHMESYYGYELGSTGYAGAVLGDKRHWVRRLPGKLLQNVISHGIARIAEFLSSDQPQVFAYGFVSPFLRNLGETELIDELRVIILEEDRTAYFTFSSQMRPALHLFRIYGSRNGLVLDHDEETLIKLRGKHFKSHLQRFLPPVLLAGQHLGNLGFNLRTFLARDFHMKSGMKYLIESFYRSIREGAPEPISHREILLTARIMDAIFDQLDRQERGGEAPDRIGLQIAQ